MLADKRKATKMFVKVVSLFWNAAIRGKYMNKSFWGSEDFYTNKTNQGFQLAAAFTYNSLLIINMWVKKKCDY